jgi:transposase-like protein
LLLKNEPVELIGNGMVVSKGEKRRIIDLHFNQGKTIRDVSRIMGKSSNDITHVTKEHRIRLAQDYSLANGEQSNVVQRE